EVELGQIGTTRGTGQRVFLHGKAFTRTAQFGVVAIELVEVHRDFFDGLGTAVGDGDRFGGRIERVAAVFALELVFQPGLVACAELVERNAGRFVRGNVEPCE